MAGRARVRLLRGHSQGIARQLVWEEGLLRGSVENWCILSRGRLPAEVVMGISGKPERLLHLDEIERARVPVIRRYSGGGTVVVDDQTLFATLIFNAEAVEGRPVYPRSIMEWSRSLYKPVFDKLCPAAEFDLREHDYVLGNLKIGGNAQSITRQRWVHHTSFLWQFDRTRMGLLKLPEGRPTYRGDRSHDEFLTELRHHVTRREGDDGPALFFDAVADRLQALFDVEEVTEAEVERVAAGNPERVRTRYLEREELLGARV